MKYQAIAPFYDRLMGHVEYDEWAELIDRIVGRYLGTRRATVLELGAGTGVLGSRLVEKGYSYRGSDLSWQMLKVAAKRGLSVFCADARTLPVQKQFDLVIFLYDGINYLQSPDEYAELFGEVARCLRGGGLFLFDITTEANSLSHFIDYIDFDDYGDYAYVRHSYYNERTTTQINDFTVFEQQGPDPNVYRKFKEHHVQKVFPVHLIEETIPRSLFTIGGIWDGFTFKRYGPRSDRIHFLLKRTKS